MLQKKSKCRAVILTSLCSFLYVPLMIGVLSNSKPSAVSATAGETVIWTGNETFCQIANSDLPEENPEYLHIEFINDDNASIYDYEAMSEIAYLSESDHGIISLSDSQWSDIRASGGLWIFSETEPFTQISYKAKEAATNYDLWIAGIQVTSENKDDILPSGAPKTGKASFNPTTNTLSLNDIFIVSQGSGSTDSFGYGDYKLNEIGIASKLDDLTINITKTSQIGEQVKPLDLDEFEFKVGIISTGDVNIVGSGKFFVYADMGAVIADNLTIDMDDDDSQLFMESNAHLDEGNYEDDTGTVLVNEDFNLLSGCVEINCFEENGVVSLGGDITIKDSQLEMEAGHDCLYTVDGDLLIDNSYIGFDAGIAATEITDSVSDDKGNTVIQNNSFVYVLTNENTVMGIRSNQTVSIDNSRLYALGSESNELFSAVATEKFEMTGNSLIYSTIGAAAVCYEGPAQITITGGTVITNSFYGLYGGGETDGLFVVGSEATPFAVKNGARIDDETGTLIPVEVCEGIVPTYDTGYGYMSNIGPADPEENDGFVEINTYATVSMSDYEYGGTVSTPSTDHEVAELWGFEMEEVMYLYYSDGETVDDAEVWDNIESDTLEVGTYKMVAYIVDYAMPMFQYYSDPVEFEVTSSTTSISKPEADTTEFTYTGEGQTYEIADNDAYTVSNNVQTDAGEYEVTVSLNDPTTNTWDDGTTDDLTYDFVIAKAQVAKPQADSSTFTYNGEDQTYDIDDNELYEISNNVQKNAGTYEVKVSLIDKDNYEWVDGTTDDVTFEFVINKAQVVKPSEDSTTFTYNGSEQTYNVSSSDHYTVSGNKATEAGNHQVTVSLNHKDNYEWADGSVENLSFNFNINKAHVAKPNADTTSFTYNGENQTYNIPSSDAYTISGNVQKNAGTYTVTVSLKDKNNTCWADGSSEDLTFTFVIAKAKVAKPAADTTSFTYTGKDQTYNIASSDLYTVSGNVAKEAGTHQVTVSLKDINNYEWEDSTTANLTYDFVITDKTCINHWFLIGILALGLVLVALSLFVLKNSLAGAISSGVFLVGSIVSTVFCGCTICIVFAVVDLALFAGSSSMFVFKSISKAKQKESEKEDK